MVEKINGAIKELAFSKGNYALVMLVPTQLNSRFAVLVSIPWMNNARRRDAIDLVVTALRKVLSNEEFMMIYRVGIIHSEDEQVKRLTKAINAEFGDVALMASIIFDTKIDYASVFVSEDVN